MSYKEKVQALWPKAYAEPGKVNGKARIVVTVTAGRRAYGMSYASAWREAWHTVLYSRELRKGAPGPSPEGQPSPKQPKGIQ